LFPEKSLMNF